MRPLMLTGVMGMRAARRTHRTAHICPAPLTEMTMPRSGTFFSLVWQRDRANPGPVQEKVLRMWGGYGGDVGMA